MSTALTQLGELMKRPEWPAAGIYHNVPASEYHAWPGASASRLKVFAKSPAHCRAYMKAPPESTPSLEIGSATHFALFQPDDFASLYLRGPCDDKRTKQWKDFAAQYPFQTVLKPDDFDTICNMVGAIKEHPAARFTLQAVTDVEVSLTWTQEGARCKARIDALAPSLKATVELKTTRDAACDPFSRSVYDLRYHWQAAHYLDGYNGLTGAEMDTHIIIAVEKEPPFAVNVFALRADAIDAGRQELRLLLAKWAECEATGEWPQDSRNYSQQFTDLTLPAYAWRQIDERISA